MCGACWDADVMEEKVRSGNNSCTGLDMETMSLDKLKYFLTQEWLKTNKNQYRVYKKAVPETKENMISWTAATPDKHGVKGHLTVSFI